MLKKSVTYMNFDDEIVTEDLFFNLTKAEIMELETSEEGGFIASMQKVVANENAGAALVGFKRLIMMAYGEKVGPDKKFVKVYNGVNLSEAFVATEAYSTILMELSSDATIAAAFINGHREGRTDFGFGHQVGKDAAAMVAIGWFDHHRQADIFSGFPGIVSGFYDHALWYRYATGFEQALGEVFVAGNGFDNGAGLVGFCRPDAALFRAVAQLHQVVFCQAHGGDLAFHGGIHNAAGAWAEQSVFGQIFQFFNCSGDIEGLVFNGGHNQVTAGGERQTGDFVVQVVHDDFVNAAAICLAGAAKAAGYAGQAE